MGWALDSGGIPQNFENPPSFTAMTTTRDPHYVFKQVSLQAENLSLLYNQATTDGEERRRVAGWRGWFYSFKCPMPMSEKNIFKIVGPWEDIPIRLPWPAILITKSRRNSLGGAFGRILRDVVVFWRHLVSVPVVWTSPPNSDYTPGRTELTQRDQVPWRDTRRYLTNHLSTFGLLHYGYRCTIVSHM